MTNLIVADYSSSEGDSGGTITSPINSSGYVQLYGVHVAGDSTKRYYSPIEIILSELNLNRPLYLSDGTKHN
ncbi:MAG TPA: hypothetical protein GXX18_02370 [Bacillales bacterium]|nr:hypothetical protein [Bacillales bacterium]